MAEQKSDEYLEIAAFFNETLLKNEKNLYFATIEAFNFMIKHCKSKSFEGIR